MSNRLEQRTIQASSANIMKFAKLLADETNSFFFSWNFVKIKRTIVQVESIHHYFDNHLIFRQLRQAIQIICIIDNCTHIEFILFGVPVSKTISKYYEIFVKRWWNPLATKWEITKAHQCKIIRKIISKYPIFGIKFKSGSIQNARFKCILSRTCVVLGYAWTRLSIQFGITAWFLLNVPLCMSVLCEFEREKEKASWNCQLYKWYSRISNVNGKSNEFNEKLRKMNAYVCFDRMELDCKYARSIGQNNNWQHCHP